MAASRESSSAGGSPIEGSSGGPGATEEPNRGDEPSLMNRPALETSSAPASGCASRVGLSGSNASVSSPGGRWNPGASFHSSVGTARTPTLSGALERKVVRPRVAGGNMRSSSSSEYGLSLGPARGLGESTEVERESHRSSLGRATVAGRVGGAGPPLSPGAIRGRLPTPRSRVGIATRLPGRPGEYAARRYVPCESAPRSCRSRGSQESQVSSPGLMAVAGTLHSEPRCVNEAMSPSEGTEATRVVAPAGNVDQRGEAAGPRTCVGRAVALHDPIETKPAATPQLIRKQDNAEWGPRGAADSNRNAAPRTVEAAAANGRTHRRADSASGPAVPTPRPTEAASTTEVIPEPPEGSRKGGLNLSSQWKSWGHPTPGQAEDADRHRALKGQRPIDRRAFIACSRVWSGLPLALIRTHRGGWNICSNFRFTLTR